MTPPAELRVADVMAGYVPGHPILRGVNITAKPGRVTVVLGPNGAGKSTMLRTVAGYLLPEAGRISLGETDITRLPAFQHVEHGIAFLPQGRSTFPDLTVSENIELGGWALRGDKTRLRQARDRVFARYPALLPLRDRPAGSLSGGQQRTVEIARLLMPDPSVLLIDEPSVGLAPIIARQIYKELEAFRDEGRTILLVDQDVRAAIGIADYVYVLSSGKNDIEGDRSAFEGDLGTMVRRWLGV
ncbi:MAG TPA: ABC transporter ATP-binding protein [Pseudolabrys sp.]|nr:ABC transporter ATP-binding protein [Pseudolabrys sp.]